MEKGKQYKGASYDHKSEKKQQELCVLDLPPLPTKRFEFNKNTIERSMAAHSFLSVQSYLCTLSFESLDNSDVSFSKVLITDSDRIALITAD